MKKQNYFIFSLIVLCASVYLGGCYGAGAGESEESFAIENTAIADEPAVDTWKTADETEEAAETVQRETVTDELNKDIDNNGVMDSLRLLEREDGTMYVKVEFNGESIFDYEWKELRLASVASFEYMDFDQDDENEIFITVDPFVNSMPLIEVMTLKQSEGQWNMMDIPLNELGNNCFPIAITKGKDEFDFIISSDYTEKQIHFDASSYYVEDEERGDNSIQTYREQHFAEGDTVGYIASWGMWGAKTGVYNERNCIIARQGIQGSRGKFNTLGTLDIYYAYDKSGNIEILDLVHEP